MQLLKAAAFTFLAASLPSLATAQFNDGENVLGAGLGLLGGYSSGWSGGGYSQSPAINLHFDHAMGELGPGTWGLGGYFGYKTSKYRSRYLTYYDVDYRYTHIVIGARGTWHYNEWHGDSNLDTYGGLMLGFHSSSYKDRTNYGRYGHLNTYSYSGGGLGFGAFLGARYYFSDQIGAYSELGYGLTFFQLGVAVKL